RTFKRNFESRMLILHETRRGLPNAYKSFFCLQVFAGKAYQPFIDVFLIEKLLADVGIAPCRDEFLARQLVDFAFRKPGVLREIFNIENRLVFE
ncbi:hypothetical protein, partial [Sunxiuqinia sp. sy24]|uniref:hypothetical protein n=1 Tax=Sunxiuqinia sp. sy24 TaxID=3461495 RepID=UPI0040459364